MIFEGLLELTAWGYFWATLLLTHVTIASVTIFLHRHQAHRALTLHPVVSHFFRFWLWLTTGMVTKEWAAIHRKHHAKCETEADPHSPQTHGIAKVLFAGAWLYRNESANAETMEVYGHGTPDDWIEHNLYSRYRFTGIGVMFVIDLLLFGAVGAIVWGVQMLWIPFWAAGVINGIGHYWGYRNFETGDASRNIVPWGIIVGGEELHNNHHAYGVSARLSNKWWEFDIGWLYIRVLEIFGLAKVKRVAPTMSFGADGPPVDMEMLRTVIANRFHVLKLYGSRVINPVMRAERRAVSGQASKLLKRAQRFMTYEHIAPKALTDSCTQKTLSDNRTLHTIYEFRQRLSELWNQHGKDHAELLTRLQAWCADAEASGIAALQEFAQQLRGYRSQFA
jgi:stearoyl-CoA desaturase (delta-9 desaturase)